MEDNPIVRGRGRLRKIINETIMAVDLNSLFIDMVYDRTQWRRIKRLGCCCNVREDPTIPKSWAVWRLKKDLELFLLSWIVSLRDCAWTISIADEWENFLERIGRGASTGEAELQESSSDSLELRFWASYRGQTLARTGYKCFVYLICLPFCFS